jgi:hypothetical protein
MVMKLGLCTNGVGVTVLRRTTGSQREEAIHGWKEPHNEDLNNFYVLLTRYCWDNVVKEDEMGGTCSTHGEV